MIWYSTDNRQKMPEWRHGAFLVAIDIDGVTSVHEGHWRRSEIWAIGCNVRPYAWAYMPDAPMERQIRYGRCGKIQRPNVEITGPANQPQTSDDTQPPAPCASSR